MKTSLSLTFAFLTCLMLCLSSFESNNLSAQRIDADDVINALASESNAPETGIAKQHTLNFGAGFPNKIGVALTTFDKINTGLGLLNIDVLEITKPGKATPQFTLFYEYGLNNEIGLGVHLGYFRIQTPEIVMNDLNNIIPTNLDLNSVTLEGVNLDNLNIEDVFSEDFDFDDLLNDDFNIDDILGGIFGSGNIDEPTETTTATLINIPSQVFSVFSFSGRLAYHRAVLPRVNMYGAAVGGVNLVKVKGGIDQLTDLFDSLNGLPALVDDLQTVPLFFYYTSVGARVTLAEKVGIYGEVGYGTTTVVNAGLTIKL